VIKPVHLSASRGVMRADSVEEFERARARLAALLDRPDVVREGGERDILVEGFIPGQEYALEGLLDRGALKVLAIFAKPDPLDGPFFEETIYVTPPGMPEATERAIAATVAHAAHALGLSHGPVHAECRVNTSGVFILEIAPRPIGGLCGRALRFRTRERDGLSLEDVLLRFALGDPLEGYGREAPASAVMMIPIPGRGRYRSADGLDDARAVEGVREVVITATAGQYVEPLPEGHSYLGFVFADGGWPEQAVARLREAHARLRFTFDRDLVR
jgi:biotin carboxylase